MSQASRMAAFGPGPPYSGGIQMLPYPAYISLAPEHRLQLERFRWWLSEPSRDQQSLQQQLHAITEDRGESGYETSAGDKLQVTVEEIHDRGMLCKTAENMVVFLPKAASRMPKNRYRLGMKLEVTVTRPETKGLNRKDPSVTDRAVRALDSLCVGETVEGRVLNVGDTGLMLDIGTALRARSMWRQLAPLNRDPSSFKVGETIADLKVTGVYKTWVEVVPKGYETRPLQSFKVGERLEGYVVRISAQVEAVFFDVGANGTVAGFAGQLAKRPEDYVPGEHVHLEVRKVARGKVWVTDASVQAWWR